MTDKLVLPLTHQQDQYVRLRCRGLTPQAAAHAVKLPNDDESLYRMHEENPMIDQLLLQMKDEIRRQSIRAGVQVMFTKDDAAVLYLEAHAKAKDATEEIKAVDSLVKLFGLAEPDKKEIAISSKQQLREMDDDALMQLAGEEILLDPSQYATK